MMFNRLKLKNYNLKVLPEVIIGIILIISLIIFLFLLID